MKQSNSQHDQQVPTNEPSKREKREKHFKRFLGALTWIHRVWYWLNFFGLGGGAE
ncbi:hypothetical protein [Vibrio splendidus]|uniref:hypothetical protein n=1 Tax=Vibrio splendidus TaxID=29497 RepID=UPI0015E73665|nr:hypothetical protein [Vibrio splendidus]